MGFRRLFSTVVVVLVALLPAVRTVCDALCVPPAAAVELPAHCASHDTAPAPETSDPADSCEHEHGGASIVIARTPSSADAIVSPAVWPAVYTASWRHAASVTLSARAAAPPSPPIVRSLPLRI